MAFFLQFSYLFLARATENEATDGEGEWARRKGDTFLLCVHTWAAAASSSTKCVTVRLVKPVNRLTYAYDFYCAISLSTRYALTYACACVCTKQSG